MELPMMTNLDTSSSTNDTAETPCPGPIRLPLEPAASTRPPGEVIELNRSTLSYILFVIILVIGAYTVGWTLGNSSNQQATITDPVAQTAPLSSPAPGQATAIPLGRIDIQALTKQINPTEGFRLSAKFGNIGPQLVAAGVIDARRFADSHMRAGQPLTATQLAILTKGSGDSIVVDSQNAYFLLSLFWALGLSNKNTLLTEGPMVQYGTANISQFASTGGWTLSAKPVTELYSKLSLLALTAEQQARVDLVATSVYRPCCNNPTHFPDCNHGMAMLGLLEFMASQNATIDDMFAAAKYVSAFWFPQQTLEVAIFLKATRGLDFAQVAPRQLVGSDLFSGAGFQAIHQWLTVNGLVGQSPNTSRGCGVE
jgi:hypothetical protein